MRTSASSQLPCICISTHIICLSPTVAELTSFLAKANPFFYVFSATFLSHYFLSCTIYSLFKYTFITSILNATHNKTTPLPRKQPFQLFENFLPAVLLNSSRFSPLNAYQDSQYFYINTQNNEFPDVILFSLLTTFDIFWWLCCSQHLT